MMNKSTSPKKILVLTANPDTSCHLRLDREVREIQEGLRQSSNRDQFIVETKWAVQTRDIRRSLMYFKPHYVHFSGHGANNGGLAVESNIHGVHLIEPDALAEMFSLFVDHVECVLLNACYSEIQANAIVQHIETVVGMTEAIDDRSAIAFSVGFYDALGNGYPAELAYKFGCNSIQLENLQGHCIPILKKRESVKTPENERSRVVFEFVITGSISDVDKSTLEAIVVHIQKITGDASLTLLEVESGSIKLIIEGSGESFRLLKSLVESGELNQVLEIPVQEVNLRETKITSSIASIRWNVAQAVRNESLPNSVRQTLGWTLSEVEILPNSTQYNSFRDWMINRIPLAAFSKNQNKQKITIVERILGINGRRYLFRISTIDQNTWRFSLEAALPGGRIPNEIQLEVVEGDSVIQAVLEDSLDAVMSVQERLFVDVYITEKTQVICNIKPEPENSLHEIFEF
jgi:hypothetical protein